MENLSTQAARLALALILGLAVVLGGCGERSPEALLASAKARLAKGDSRAAVIDLKNLLQRDPNHGEARLLLGEIHLADGDFASAEKELARAIGLRQPHEKVLPPYARALLAQGKYQAVIAELEKYKLFSPAAIAPTQTAMGDAYRQLRNTARARDAYAAALAAVPGYPSARLGQAALAALDGQVDEALRQVDDLISTEPKLAEARSLRAELLLAKGDRNGAIAALREAIQADPKGLWPRLLLANLLIASGDLEAAGGLLETTRKIAPRDLRVRYYEAALAYRRGHNDAARQQLQDLLRYLPDNVQALALAGAVELRDRKPAAAAVHLQRALAKAPNHYGVRLMLVQTHLQLGQPTRAKEVLQPLLDRGTPEDRRLLLIAGETALANGEIEQASAFYKKAAAAKGSEAQDATAKTRLGQIALASGRFEEGFRELEAASQLEGSAYQADLALIAGYLRARDFDKAMEAAQALEKKQPNNPLTFQIYGVVNAAKGDLAAARRSFERALELQPTYLAAAYSLAELDLADNKPEQARSRLEALASRDPKSEQPLLVLAQLQARTGVDEKEIGANLRRAVAANSQSTAAHLALLSFLLRTGDTKAAVAAAQSAQSAFPADPRILAAAGSAMEAAGQVNQALDIYGRMAALQPQATQPLYLLAALHLRQKETDKAVENLRRAQKLGAPRGRIAAEIVAAYVGAGRFDDALRESRQLQKAEPKAVLGYTLEGDVHFTQRRYAEAERVYREALKLEPQAGAVAVKYYAALQAAGKKAEAQAWGRKWLAENPKDVLLRANLAQRAILEKDYRAAAAQYQEVIRIDPTNASALNNLAWIGGRLQDPKAIGYAEQAVKIAPFDPAILDTYGMLLVKQGEFDKGLRVLERVRKLAPARNDFRLNYAKALAESGRKTEARKELEALQAVQEHFLGKEEVAALLKQL
jgi:putative PEP-CTERM system TPR-repeat lipoprotein